MGRLFGTDGVRGVANDELTIELAFKIGQAGAYVLTKENKHKPTILVSYDTRISGEMLSMALMAGICSVGANAIDLGILPTPAVSYLTKKYKADAGVVISASHNPVEYNGIKFFDSNGYKLKDELEEEIEGIILDQKEKIQLPTGTEIGRVRREDKGLRDYVDYAKQTIKTDLSGIKLVVDCGNGAAYAAAPIALKELGAQIICIHNQPDGTNINKDCGSTHMEDLMKAVVENKADLGIAFDGDADRMLAVDEDGMIVDGDQIMAICGKYLKEQGLLKQDTIVATVMSNLGFFIMGREQEIHIKQTKVGDRYVLEEMLEKGYNLGGEQSGHIIFLDNNTTGDGLVSALHLLEVIVSRKKSLKELTKIMKVLPQVLVNAKVPNEKKNAYLEDAVIKKSIQDLENKFQGGGRVLIRPSGTEPLVRVMIEGSNIEELQREAEALANIIVSRLN